MKRLNCICGALTLLLAGSLATAQQESTSKPTAPIPPVYGGGVGGADNTPVPADEMSADKHSLSGAQLLTLGTAEASQNTLTPSFHFAQTFDTHSQLHDNSIGTQGISSFGGSLLLDRTTEKQNLKLQYTGGSVLYSDSSNLDSSYHQFGISENIQLRRWTLTFSDDVSYSPESPLSGGTGAYGGFGFFGDPVLSGLGGLSGLSSTLLPNQSIYTLNSSRVSNNATAQVGYNFSERTTWDASFGYGLLRFLDQDFLDSNEYMFRSGVSHNFNAKDSVAVTYIGSMFTYTAFTEQIRTHAIQLSYARRLTGRLTFQVAGGPQIYTQDFASLSDTNVTPSGSSSLQYSRGRNSLSAGFSAGVGGGSGVLIGAKTYQFSGGWSRQWTRNWTTSINGGYSRNDALTAATSYDSGFAGMQVSRSLGRSASVYVSYTWQKQLSSAASTLLVFGPDFQRHVIGFGFDWHFRPIRLGR